MSCSNNITIPPLLSDNCNGNQISTDCTIYEEPIAYLGLPANSTATVVINSLLSSLKDARDRVTDLETGGGVVNASQYTLTALNSAPPTSSYPGTLGEIRYTATAIYLCVSTNTWVKAALTSF